MGSYKKKKKKKKKKEKKRKRKGRKEKKIGLGKGKKHFGSLTLYSYFLLGFESMNIFSNF